MTATRKTLNLKRNIYIDPAGGSDANPGTLALPFATWDAGAWPLIASLRHTDVLVTYTSTTGDTSLGGTSGAGALYALPVGVRVTLSSPWVSLIGVRTAAGGTSASNVVDTVGGFTVNAFEGARLRWLTGPSAGKVFFVQGNGATTFTGVGGWRGGSLGVAGNTFVIERPQGGWQPNSPDPGSDFELDATAAGACFTFLGFNFAPAGGNIAVDWLGEIQAAGLLVDTSVTGTFAAISAQGELAFGQVSGGLFIGQSGGNNEPPLGTVATLGCTFLGFAGGINELHLRSCQALLSDLLMDEADLFAADGPVTVEGYTSRSDSGSAGATLSACAFAFSNVLFTGTDAFAIFTIEDGATGTIGAADFSATRTGDAIVVTTGATLGLNNATGVGATAGKVGVRVSDHGTLLNGGSNTVAGPAGVAAVDGVTYATWASITGVASNVQNQGIQIPFAGSHVGGAGAVTTFYGQGGAPTVANSSATALRWPMPVGSNLRNLRGTILANGSTTTVTYTVMVAPLATGTPGATALVVSVTAGTTGSVADTTHTALAQSGDQLDLRSQNTNGGSTPVTSTWGLQAA